jgi:predicted XRE-type DNA-binding protein
MTRSGSCIRATRGSGNIYVDLGLEHADLEMARAELAARVVTLVERGGLTTGAAAKLLGVSRSEVSALVRGQLHNFSIDRLFHCLTALGCDVAICVSRSRRRSFDSIRVIAT